MNIFIAYISTISEKTNIAEYSTNNLCSQTEKIESLQTNETALKCLYHMLEEKGETIGKVISILSNEAYSDPSNNEIVKTAAHNAGKGSFTAYDYFKHIGCRDIESTAEFKEIHTLDNEKNTRSNGELVKRKNIIVLMVLYQT